MKSLSNGFTTRNATMADIQVATNLMNAFSLHYQGDNEAPLDAIRNEWLSPRFNPETDVHLVFSPAGQAVGYVEVWTTSQPPVHPWVWWCVHPHFEANGIGLYLLDWAEMRARQALEQVPAELRVAFWSSANSQIEYSQRTLAEYGMQPIRYNFRMLIEMENPPAPPVWPQGIQLRVFNPERDDLAEIYRADIEAFRDHFGFIEQPFEEGLERFRHFMLNDKSHDPNLWFMAIDMTQAEQPIAGICLCRKESYEDPNCGWVNTLGVRRAWRQRGIGLALLQHSFETFYQRGLRRVGLGVDGMNLTGALRLYENAGMHIDRRYDLYEKVLRPGREISVQSL